ncbi:MAG: hypothetical protein AAGJ92_02505, partial [Pseudomonadota bacterium]
MTPIVPISGGKRTYLDERSMVDPERHAQIHTRRRARLESIEDADREPPVHRGVEIAVVRPKHRGEGLGEVVALGVPWIDRV